MLALRYHLFPISVQELPSPPPHPYPCSLVKVVLFGEIEVNPSDVKHVMELVGCSDGLGMVIMAHTHHWDVV